MLLCYGGDCKKHWKRHLFGYLLHTVHRNKERHFPARRGRCYTATYDGDEEFQRFRERSIHIISSIIIHKYIIKRSVCFVYTKKTRRCMDELLDYEDKEQKNHGSMRNFIENQSGF